MKHSKEELKLFQSFPLDVKMGKTALRIRELAEHDFYVSFSGGKDSEVAVDFVARTLSEIGIQQMYVANVNTGLEYLSVQRFCKPFCEMVSKKYGIKIILDTLYPKITFKAVLEKYGYPIISKEVAQCIFEARKGIANGDGTYSYRIQKLNGTYKDKNGNLSPYNCSKYKFLLDAPFKISHLCCHEMKKHPAYEYEALTGRIPLIATTTEESRARKSAWLKHGCNVFDAKRPLSAPFSFWTDNDILTYIHQENLPVADAYGKVVPEDDGIDGQINMFEEIGYEGCRFKTTGCPRTGCIYCLFGITQDINRIIRLYEMEPKRADYVLRGGKFNDEGMWIPSDEGLGYWYILDWLARHGIDVPYPDKEKYRLV